MRHRIANTLWYAVLVLLALQLVWLTLPIPPEWIEAYYTSGLFAAVTAPLVWVQQLVPISMTTLIGTVVVPAGLFAAITAVAVARRRGVAWRSIAWTAARCTVALVVLGHGWFLTTFGVGYRRAPIETRLGLVGGDAVSREDLDATLDDMLTIIEKDLENPEHRDEAAALLAIGESMAEMVEAWDGKRPPLPHNVKRLPGGLLIVFGAYGINSPLLMEPHTDGALPSHAVVSTGAHELAHVAGFSGEADATLAGLLAGLRADHPYARYASALSAFANLTAELSREEQRARVEMLPAEALNDLRAEAEVYKRYTREMTHTVFQPVYHSYLVTQGVSEGIEDYSRGARLFVNAWHAGLAETPSKR
jgi:hypothetical protein